MHILSLTLVFSSFSLLASAGSQTKGENCTTQDNRLQIGSYEFHSDCDTHTYCSDQGICQPKGCRKDQFPLGYLQSDNLPPKCSDGQFCPDEGDACQPLLAVSSPCQLNRDDQCEPPPNWAELADTSRYGRNVNGSVCLNNVCMWANVTVGQPCVVENTAYIAYASSGEFIDVVSRGNCRTGSYCDSQQLVCMQSKALGASCTADKECASYNCEGNGVCGRSSDIQNEFGIWVYVLVGLSILGGMCATLVGLALIHGRQRDAEREKRRQYWQEQNELRQHLQQMQETARMSIVSRGSSKRNTLHSHGGSEDSSKPMLPHAAPKASGLRHIISDDGSDYDEDSAMMMQPR